MSWFDDDDYYCCEECGQAPPRVKRLYWKIESSIREFGRSVRELYDAEYHTERERQREVARILAKTMYTKETVAMLNSQTPFQALAARRSTAIPTQAGRQIQFFRYKEENDN